MTPSSDTPTSDASLRSPVPERPYVQTPAGLAAGPDAVHAVLDDLDATWRRRDERRRAATRELVAELYARDGVTPSPGRIDAEAEAACAQEQEERLAAELRHLVTPPVAAVRRARTLSERELDRDCQAALNVLGTAPRSLAEFQPEAERRHAAERAALDGFAARETETASYLEEARGWQFRRRRGLGRALAEARRGRAAAEHRTRLAAARLAAVQLREAQRAEWRDQLEVQGGAGGQVSAVDAGLGGCAWRRCQHPVTVVVSFQAPHPLAGTSRGYCGYHAAQVGGQPGAVLTGVVGRVPVQEVLPGLDLPAEPGWPPLARGGGR